MTEQCIDEVAMPMRQMQLREQEFVVLKLIMLFRNDGEAFWENGLMEESDFFILFIIRLTFFKLTSFLRPIIIWTTLDLYLF